MEDYLNTKGRIFDIQRFSIHDGPGIRTIVFLKGCFFRCRWCCNPESQKYEIEEMVTNGKVKTVGRDVTVKEVMQEVMKDAPYYRRSGGGVTLSGGESLGQPDFAVALLRACKDQGYTTAMESTAYASFDIIQKYLPYLDTYLMDIKHMDAGKHKAFVGQPNDLVLENAKKIAASGKTELIIRVPVIPTFNETPDEIRAIARFAATLPGVREIHLLPYHRLGYDKYKGLGREYTLEHIDPPGKEHMEMLRSAAAESGLTAIIGG